MSDDVEIEPRDAFGRENESYRRTIDRLERIGSSNDAAFLAQVLLAVIVRLNEVADQIPYGSDEA